MGRPGLLAALSLAAAAAAGCGAGQRDAGGDGAETVTVYVSAPLSGERAREGRAIADGARLALADAGGAVDDLRVEAKYLDDALDGGWSLVRTAQNARAAAEDSSSIGFIGDLDSGATRVSLPITNQAGIAQISPASTAVELTRLSPAGGASPDRYQPGDRRTFARVVPADDVQGRAAARWAERMGVRAVAVAGDGSAFGRVLADAFRGEAAGQGLRIGPGDPELIYYAGDAAGFREATAGLPERPTIGSDALVNPAFLPTVAGRRLFVTSQFLDPTLLPARGKRFARRYRQRFGRRAEPAAAYGYEAMALLLDAIRRAGEQGDVREVVVDEVLESRNRKSAIGTYSIDGNGDTTLDSVSGYRVSDGVPVAPVSLRAPR